MSDSAFAKEKSKSTSAKKGGASTNTKGTAKGKASGKSNKATSEEQQTSSIMHATWGLRDHFKFPEGKTVLRYAVETCEWTVELEQKTLIDNACFEISLADGSSLNASSLGKAQNERVKFTNSIGAGVSYVNTFPEKDGIVVRHSLSKFNDRLFFLFGVGIGNDSQKPIEVSKITLASFAPGGIANLSADTRFSNRRFEWNGGAPVFKADGTSMLSILEDRAKGVTMAFGVLPQGVGKTGVNLASNNGAWVGDITCVFDPPIRIEPGQKFESDSVWCSFAIPTPLSVDENYAWSLSLQPHPHAKELPRAWVTTPRESSQADLLAAVDAWKGVVKHVLVPATWEGRPGSLDGSSPKFPKDMGKFAKQLSAAGAVPGITVEPLMTSGGGADWVAKSPDGTSWLNLANPDAKKQAVERMRKVVGWDYKFFVVAPSSIPNEVLKNFNMTRAQAQSAAVAVMSEAAGGLPVFGASSGVVKASCDAWLDVAATENRLGLLETPVGPARFEVGGLQSIDGSLLKALELTRAPIEFVGAPKGQLAGQLARVLSSGARAFPVDASNASPKLWIAAASGDEGVRGYGVSEFPGAQPWKFADLNLGEPAGFVVWRASDGQSVDASAAVSPASAFSLYGVTPKPTHPVLMGASTRADLSLGDLKSLAWDEKKGVLSGAFSGAAAESATAYVAVPDGWSLVSGKANDQSVSKKGTAGVVEFSVASGSATKFELKFAKK
jgi:hypothetical protein